MHLKLFTILEGRFLAHVYCIHLNGLKIDARVCLLWDNNFTDCELVLMALAPEGIATTHPYRWAQMDDSMLPIHGRALEAAHDHIVTAWSTLPNGSVIEADVILGDRAPRRRLEIVGGRALAEILSDNREKPQAFATLVEEWISQGPHLNDDLEILKNSGLPEEIAILVRQAVELPDD